MALESLIFVNDFFVPFFPSLMTDRFVPQRLIIVDDNDKNTGISYTGDWSLDNTDGAWNGVGDNGSPFLSTLHKTTSTSSVSFRFRGPPLSNSLNSAFA